jgi:hypothetical protein
MSSRAYLYTAQAALERFAEGVVYYWPLAAQKQGLPPVKGQLIRVKGGQGKGDVWLLTSVLSRGRLRRGTASKFYRWRWRNEGLFRTYKRTLGKVKLWGRTVRLVHREAEGSLPAVPLLLAQGVLALRRGGLPEALVSPRGVLLAIRAEIQRGLGPRQYRTFEERLRQARCEQRRRRSAKARRVWPRRKPHKAPKPPKLLTLTDELKALMAKVLKVA